MLMTDDREDHTMDQDHKQPGRMDNDEFAAYLDDHLLGAKTGIKLFGSARESWAGTEFEADLQRLRNEVIAERREVKELMGQFGYRRSTFKKVAAAGGAVVGKINPLNPLRIGGGAGAQLELETLQSALRGKECLWRTLIVLAEAEPRLDAQRFQQLLDQTHRQLDTMARIMEQTAKDRFLAKPEAT
jgi:hypothetical protein